METTNAAQPILQVRDLRVQAGSQPILKGVSFDLYPGEVLGLIGESGAGKSTLGLAALGHMRGGCACVGGEVLFRGQDVFSLPPRQAGMLRGRKITYVAQSAAASFNPAYTLQSQIAEPLRRGGGASAPIARTIRNLFRRLGLPQPDIFGARYPHQVSGGQLQRAMTAMALAPEPDIVVFDEPTTALDVTTQLEVLAAIKQAIREEGSAALYISHDLAVVSQISDRIMVLRHGQTVEEGTTRELIDTPKQDYTRRLLNVSHAVVPAAVREEAEDEVLSIRGLSARYGSVPVLEDVTLGVRRGTTLAVVGESGSGKSTLAKVVTGLVPAAGGTLTFAGKALRPTLKARDKDTLRRMQMIFQIPDTALNPRQTVGEIIGRPLSFYFGLPRAAVERRVANLLRDIELGPEFARRYPSELSGGQKQRVCIARALAADPDLIICDEVTSALDPLVAEGIIKLLRRLQQEKGVSYIFITHDLGTVKAIAHDIAVMRRGRVVDCGARDAVLSPPFHPYTELLFTSLPTTREGWLEEALAKQPDPDALDGTVPGAGQEAGQANARTGHRRGADRPVASGLGG
ncbi:ABC transporter ATP-binding protein [Azospirillum canadense]|uniref:ABC transporter ATP-binding protein n=1 Tax=Azospirillum canadense TaxID=403962 RepID=UPI0022271565|nr:ABC transporter ATP-binding protein [Azospirillum canadense]MCW2241178.1 peptide/nickel transport system ATP-binding protein [Azospirillum canadense]